VAVEGVSEPLAVEPADEPLLQEPTAADFAAPEPAATEPTTAESVASEPAAPEPVAAEVTAPDVVPDDEPEPAEELVAAAVALTRLRPGEVTETRISIWGTDAADSFRVKLRDTQTRFVDDPARAVGEAQAIVADAVNTLAATLAAALLEAQAEIDPSGSGAEPDTESLRVALRGYREFLDRVLAL
jgi:hypothetical protein